MKTKANETNNATHKASEANNATYTPGPWEARWSERGRYWFIDYEMGGEGYTLTPLACGPANARLIAAAPELLACLLDVLDADGDLYAMDFDRYRAAIAKATGLSVD